MACADYYLCDQCDKEGRATKVFYDANVEWEYLNGVVVAICKTCAESYDVLVTPKNTPAAPVTELASVVAGWLPIADAPKDGRFQRVGWWANGNWCQCDAFYYLDDTWVAEKTSDHEDCVPTHYLPIPAPPVNDALNRGREDERLR